MTENSKKVFEYLKKNYGKEFTKHELVEQLDVNMSAVSGSVNGLIRNGLAEERIMTLPARFPGEAELQIRYIHITEKGKAFDPDEEERKKAQALLEARAARREARRLEKEELARKNSVL